MGRACSTYKKDKKQKFTLKNTKGKDRLEEVGTDGLIILILISNRARS
jgi:hypothetical protein